MRTILLTLGLCFIMIAISCGDGNVIIRQDPAIQAAEDSAIIINYLADLGYEGDEIGTTTSGVRYVILKPGTGAAIMESDIVTFDYTGKLLSDTIFDTSIKAVADSIIAVVAADTVGKTDIDEQLNILNSFPESKRYESFTFTYSSTGWTLSSSGFIQGYVDGISTTFNQVNVGAAVLIVIPSQLAYGNRSVGNLIDPNSVLAFELYPTASISQ